MEEIRQWLPLIIQVVTTAVIITLAFGSLKKDIAVIKTIMDEKFHNVEEKVGEIKDNHLVHLASDVKELDNKLTEHLINHGK